MTSTNRLLNFTVWVAKSRESTIKIYVRVDTCTCNIMKTKMLISAFDSECVIIRIFCDTHEITKF